MSMHAEAQAIIHEAGFTLWEVDSDETIICPDGVMIEWDGTCECHGDSPLMQLGFI